ncbi:winged helix DNA-binding protein [uncultured Parasphingopyxis sp.]|uniref:winged helix DNA-binding protein n=1 Tax=uncultured Parasphingopyxis sp. TaxID=1547918 RepID=UPI00263062A4|nr:winged helix DNA-binding protein [uncultured Parasphingopyxis sp.]
MTASNETAFEDGPAILAIADGAAGLARIGRAARAVNGRVVAEVEPAGAVERLKRQAALDIAMLDCEDGDAGTLDPLFSALDEAAASGLCRAVVAVPLDLLDLADARLAHRDIQLLCQPGPLDLAAATGVASVRPPLTLHDNSRREAEELARLGEEVARIAESLARLASGEEGGSAGSMREAPFQYRAAPVETADIGAEDVRRLIRHRRMRDRFFDGALFADPAWDILLDLMAARIEGRPVSVSSLCIAAAVPATTALRWIRTMTDRGLLVRDADPRDGRRVFIRLGDEASRAVSAWFAATRADPD